MRGKLALPLPLPLGVGAASALVLVVSLVSVSVAGPNVSRLAVVEHATTDTVVDLTTNGDSTGDLLTFHNELFDAGNENVVGADQGECVRAGGSTSSKAAPSRSKGPSSMRVPRRWPSPEARERIEERAGACVSCLVTRPGRSSTSSSGS